MTIPFSELELMMSSQKPIEINYTNWKNETRWRSVDILELTYGYPDPKYYDENLPEQFLLTCWDREIRDKRTFRLSNIHAWRYAEKENQMNRGTPVEMYVGIYEGNLQIWFTDIIYIPDDTPEYKQQEVAWEIMYGKLKTERPELRVAFMGVLCYNPEVKVEEGNE